MESFIFMNAFWDAQSFLLKYAECLNALNEYKYMYSRFGK